MFEQDLFIFCIGLFQVDKTFYNQVVHLKKLASIGSRIPFTTLPSKISHFKWILSFVLKFKNLSLVYRPGEPA